MSSGSLGTGRQHSARESVEGLFQKRHRTISTNSSIQPCKYFQITDNRNRPVHLRNYERFR